jgi:hypothetical protein
VHAGGFVKRRQFLQGVGGAVLAAPFLTTTIRRSGAATLNAKRLVMFHTHGGCITTRWFPQAENGVLTAADLAPTTLDVFAPSSDKLLLPRGITALNGMGKPQTIDPHVQGMGSKLTCSLLDEETRLATSHSLDHAVALQLNANGAGPLYVNPGWSFADPMTYLSFAGSNEPTIPVSDAWSIYAQLTSSLLSSSTAQEAARALLRQSALDVVRDDLTRLEAVTTAQSDRKRLQQWKDLLRQTETNLAGEALACNADQVNALGITEGKLHDVSDAAEPDAGTRISARGDVLMDLMALTLICDTNRSLLFSYPGFMRFDWDGVVHDADIDALNHRTGSASTSGECFPNVLDKLLQADRWYAAKFYRLVALLDSIPEGETTLLDNTATLWLREFSDGGAMNLNNMPLLIAGSCGGYLKQGVAVSLEDATVGPGNSENSCTEPGDTVSLDTGTDASRGLVPINKLYVTLMNAVGCQVPGGGPVTEFGAFDSATAEAGITDPGELTALRA